MRNFKFEGRGNLAVASGDGFEYQKIGDLSKFTQTAKVPSLRKIKCKIKFMLKINASLRACS